MKSQQRIGTHHSFTFNAGRRYLPRLGGILLLLIVTVAAAGCSFLFPPKKHYYQIVAERDVRSAPAPRGPTTLAIAPFEANEEYDTEFFLIRNERSRVYRPDEYRWMALPSEMVRNIAVQMFTTARPFGERVAVLTSGGDPAYTLRGRLLELTAIAREQEEEPDSVRVSLQIMLYRGSPFARTPDLVLRKIYRQSTPISDGCIESIPSATGSAVTDITEMAVQDVAAAISSE